MQGNTEKKKGAVIAAVVMIACIWIMSKGMGLREELDFGAGAYYYADIPDFEKYLGHSVATNIPYIVYVLLFLAWGYLMWLLWKWIDRRR